MSVVATLVVGSDGSTSKESRSAGISSPEDRQAFLKRRREVDVIIVGGNTARHEPYNRTPVPLVVISRSLVNPVQGNHLLCSGTARQLWRLKKLVHCLVKRF